ncbi:UNVERIFIED_CONTAM: hypothetical protein Sradi_3865600 [Sesamum radiatum]|uniref:Uncharacterized protein n=1 Tax=Sesamum radiatum TaxID=300843 RepID=A0AAW2Q1Y1_SESRA
MIFYAARSAFYSSTYNQDGAPNDGTRLCPIDAERSSSYYGRGPYDYVSGLVDEILPHDHILPLDYYNTKKLIKYLGLPTEKIDTCRNGCMLYWKDDIYLEYCKFCGEASYQPIIERNPNGKKTPYAILRYLSLTLCLQRLYAPQVTTLQMKWHANH